MKLDQNHVLFLYKQHRQKLLTTMKAWVHQVHDNSPFGAVLVNNQILPLVDHKGERLFQTHSR